jgi:tripeptidyl-peptidase-1
MKALILLALAVASVTGRWVQMETDVRVASPSDWSNLGRVPTEETTVIFALKHDAAKLKEVDRIFWEVSDPKHANYGKYLTFEESNALMAAPQLHIDIVEAYLAGFGVRGTLNAQHDMVTLRADSLTIERMLNTKLAKFRRIPDGMEYIRATEPYYLPAEVAIAVDIVANLLDFPRFHSPKIVEPNAVGNWANYCGLSCSGKIVPQVIWQQYQVSQSLPVNAKASFAVAEFEAQHYDQNDLDMFTKACNIQSMNVINVGNAAGSCPLTTCIEALLDLEYMQGVGSPNGTIPLSDVYTVQYSLLDWINTVLGQANPSLVHSVSYGNDEIQQTSTDYMYTCNTQFQAAANRGLSILFASGDQGVWGRSGRGTGQFNPDFPASSPYITAVGGSDYVATGGSVSIGAAQTCCTDGGGGFSNTFARPSYQDSAVTGYLNSGVALPASNLYNATSRAYPDISAIFGLTVSYCITSGGGYYGVAGTSASSPVTASVIANLNNIQLNAGKAALGFLNPWLYQTLASNPTAFYDVTTGINNEGSGAGFNAYKGWDPCTGVGTPYLAQMAKYLP